MGLIVFILFVLITMLFRQKARKGNFFRLGRRVAGEGKYFRYQREKSSGYWKLLILCLMLGTTWLANFQFNFLATSIIEADQGIPVMLPPKIEVSEDAVVKERNILSVLVNSSDQLLVEEEIMDVKDLKAIVKAFISNRGKNPEMSESPQKAIIALKTDRGTSYELYVKVRDTLQLAYNELRAEHVGLTIEEFLEVQSSLKLPENKKLYDKAKDEYPVMISDVEPGE